MFNSDGSAYTTLQSLGPYSKEPDLSVDGSMLAFIDLDSGEVPQVYTANYDGTGRIQRTFSADNKKSPRISPDNSKVVYERPVHRLRHRIAYLDSRSDNEFRIAAADRDRRDGQRYPARLVA